MKVSIQRLLSSAERSRHVYHTALGHCHQFIAMHEPLGGGEGGGCSCAASWGQQGKRILCSPTGFLAVHKEDSWSTQSSAALRPFPTVVLACHSSVLPPLLALHPSPFLPVLGFSSCSVLGRSPSGNLDNSPDQT